MQTIYYDSTTGKLAKDRIWFWVSPDLEKWPGLVRGELSSWNAKFRHDCPLDRRHETGVETKEIVIDLVGGNQLGDFIPEVTLGHLIVTEQFTTRMKESGLKGFTFKPIVRVAVNQTGIKTPKLYFLYITGIGGVDRRLKVKGKANVCPHCRMEPVVCEGCGTIQRECLRCGKATLALSGYAQAPDSKGFRFDGYPPEAMVVQADEWDGSDWFECGGAPFINKQAKDWLESMHAFPIASRPALLDLNHPRGVMPTRAQS
jgi:hypothetical protein